LMKCHATARPRDATRSMQLMKCHATARPRDAT